MIKRNAFHLMAAITVALMSVGFASCSSNEDNEILSGTTINKEDLLGSWVLIHSEGWQMSDDEKNTFDYTFDPLTHTSDDIFKTATKIVFTDHSQDTFKMTVYEWHPFNKEWENPMSDYGMLVGDELITEIDTGVKMTVSFINPSTLVMEVSSSIRYNKQTYERMD